MGKTMLDPQERENIVEKVAEVIGILTTTSTAYMDALEAIAHHLKVDHSYDIKDAIEETSLITSDALRHVADVSHEAALRAISELDSPYSVI